MENPALFISVLHIYINTKKQKHKIKTIFCCCCVFIIYIEIDNCTIRGDSELLSIVVNWIHLVYCLSLIMMLHNIKLCLPATCHWIDAVLIIE